MPETQTSDQVRHFVSAAVFAALTAVGAWIAVPIGPVPVTLQLLFVFLAALLLRPRYAVFSMVLYVLMGLIGLPVYAAGGSGIAVLIGPTGGYLIGFVLGAGVGSAIQTAFGRPGAPRLTRIAISVLALLACAVVIYGLGAVWGKFQTGIGWGTILLAWVLPFIPGDAVKLIIAVIVGDEVRRRGIVVPR